MQTVVVMVLVGVSLIYLIRHFLKSVRGRDKKCSSCGKEE